MFDKDSLLLAEAYQVICEEQNINVELYPQGVVQGANLYIVTVNNIQAGVATIFNNAVTFSINPATLAGQTTKILKPSVNWLSTLESKQFKSQQDFIAAAKTAVAANADFQQKSNTAQPAPAQPAPAQPAAPAQVAPASR